MNCPCHPCAKFVIRVAQKMSLKDRINFDYRGAFKAKEEKRVSVLRMLNSAIKNRELEKRTKLIKTVTEEAELQKQSQLIDEETLAVLSAEAKKRKDSISQFSEGGRPELAAGEEEELKILAAYLPEQMGEAEIRKFVKEAIAESGAAGAADLGKVMKVLMPKVKGRADGGLVTQIVKEELGK